jgi:high-affinity Fe2+/Pb2+ permease
MPNDERKPAGSGYFAAICGALFAFAFAGSFFVDLDQVSPTLVMRAWFLFVAAVLLWWGINRARTGRPDATVGQDTINLVLAIAGSSIALLGLLLKR